MNYLSLNDYQKAIQLALAMEQPGRLLSLFKDIRTSSSPVESESLQASITGHPSVDEVIRTLGVSDLSRLLRYVRDWNANAKTSGISQGVLYAVVKLRSAEDVMNAFSEGPFGVGILDGMSGTGIEAGVKTAGAGGTALKELVDALIPYTERHLSRMEKLVQESYVVDYILGEMDDGMFDGELEDGVLDGMDVDMGVGMAA